MKKAKLVSALALAALSATAQAGPTEALTLPSAIWLDGFCDGLTNITKVSRYSYSATYDATTFCGDFNAPAGGPIGRNMTGASVLGQGAVFTIETFPFYGVTVMLVLNGDGTWAAVDTAGSVFNSGTWTAGALANQRGTRAGLRR